MIQKRPIVPNKVRKVPKQFSWVDHRLVRDHHIERFSHQAAALYLFLITVADSRGLSYYSDSALIRLLKMDETTLKSARYELKQLRLIAWKKPIYQVLPIENIIHVPVAKEQTCEASRETSGRDAGQLLSIGQIFKRMAQES